MALCKKEDVFIRDNEYSQHMTINRGTANLLTNDITTVLPQIETLSGASTASEELALQASIEQTTNQVIHNRYVSPVRLKHHRPTYIPIDGYSHSLGGRPLEKYLAYTRTTTINTTYQLDGFTSNSELDTSKIIEVHILGYVQTYNWYKWPKRCFVSCLPETQNMHHIVRGTGYTHGHYRSYTFGTSCSIMAKIPINRKHSNTIRMSITCENAAQTNTYRSNVVNNHWLDNYAGYKIIGVTVL